MKSSLTPPVIEVDNRGLKQKLFRFVRDEEWVINFILEVRGPTVSKVQTLVTGHELDEFSV